MVADYMLHHINSLEKNTLIFNRDFLNYTSRNYVDVSLFRLLNDGYVRRLARGIYVRSDCDKNFTAEELAEAKARMWNRTTIVDPEYTAIQLRFVVENGSQFKSVHASGRKTSFLTKKGRVLYKETSPRRLALTQLKTGAAINALWWLTKEVASEGHVGQLLCKMNRLEKEEFVWSHHLMTGWLSDLVHSTRRWKITFPLGTK